MRQISKPTEDLNGDLSLVRSGRVYMRRYVAVAMSYGIVARRYDNIVSVGINCNTTVMSPQQ